MKENMSFNKIIYLIIAVLIAVIILTAAFIAISNSRNNGDSNTIQLENSAVEYNKNTEAEVSEIEEGKLPSENELSELGLEKVMQTSKINKQFNLSNYEVLDGGIKYNYLASAVTNGERLSITAKAMTEGEYNEMLPTAKAQESNIDDVAVVYNDRNLYYTTDGAELPPYVKNAEEAGNVVVRYGNSTSELIPMQQLMWYSNGIGYTLESIARNYTYEDMAQLAEDFFSEAK